MVRVRDILDDEWADWLRLTPQQRWRETEKLWQMYLAMGGCLDPEPDSQSPFHDTRPEGPMSAHGRTGVRVVRSGGV